MKMDNYNCMACCSGSSRGFLTKEEKIEMLQDYKKNLELETQGVSEKIVQLKEE